jgi:ABC-type sugar transport system substrate-binding protein
VNAIDVSRRSGWRRGRAAAAALCAAVLLLSACSRADNAKSDSSDSSVKVDEEGLATAKALVEKLEQQPTTIDITTPIGKPVPSGKTIDFISCGTPNCGEEGEIVQQAADYFGWTVKTINTDGTPESQKAAFAQVARDKAFAVFYSAIDKSTFAAELEQIKANGTFVAAATTIDSQGDGLDYVIGDKEQVGVVGQTLAAWTIAENEGKAKAVYVNLPSFSILSSTKSNYMDYMDQNCPSCSTDSLDLPITSLGKDAATKIVAYLRKNPDVNTVVICTDAVTIGLPAALKAAGMDDIKIIGQGADTTNLQYIHAGQETASVAFPYYEVLWAMVDAAARHAAGVEQVPSTWPQAWILTQDNAPDATSIFPTVANYEAAFTALWGVS